MKANQKGFSIVEILIVIVAVGLLGAVGWLVYDRQKSKTDSQPPTSQNTTTQTEAEKSDTEQKSEAAKKDRKTITFNGATYSFALPSGWQHKEMSGYPGPDSNEKIVQITDPSNQYQLDIQTIDSTGSVSEGNTPEASFSGIGGKTYYLEGYKGTAANDFETVFISACETKHCVTPVNATYELNLSIKRTSDNDSKGVAVNAPEVEVIKQIVASIKIGG